MENKKMQMVSKITKYSFYIGLVSLLLSFIFIPFLLITVLSAFVFVISLIIDTIKNRNVIFINEKDYKEDKNAFKSYFLGVDSLRKSDGNVQRGECEIIFEDENFKIKQNEEIIENSIQSIYYFDIWEYKDDTYFKFRMRSGAEYKFCSQHFEADKIAKMLAEKGIKIEDNRNDE